MELQAVRKGFSQVFDFLKILEQKVTSLETLVEVLLEKKSLPEFQEFRHYQVCYV